jgi:hypothetical protein
MISTLILNTLLGCQTSKPINEGPASQTPPIRPPDATDTEKPNPSEIPPHLRESSNKSTYSGPISLSLILKTIGEDNTVACEDICTHFKSISGAARLQVGECEMTLDDDWEDKLNQYKLDSTDGPAGELTNCNYSISYIRKGRAPAQMKPLLKGNGQVGRYFARSAQEEGISVFAFAELIQFFEQNGYDKQLIERCKSALEDEIQHTKAMVLLCKEHHHPVPHVKFVESDFKSPFEWARHNALHGCIAETWAAVLESYRAEHTQYYKDIFTVIAEDEVRHAILAWDIFKALNTRLSTEEQDIIKDEMLKTLKREKLFESHFEMSAFGEPTEEKTAQLWGCFQKNVLQILQAA